MMERVEDRLDRLLREDAKRMLQDEGFTERVLRALPPPAMRISVTPVLMIVSAVAGGALASAFAPIGSLVVEGLVEIGRLQLGSPAAVVALAMMATLLVSSIVLVAEAD